MDADAPELEAVPLVLLVPFAVLYAADPVTVDDTAEAVDDAVPEVVSFEHVEPGKMISYVSRLFTAGGTST